MINRLILVWNFVLLLFSWVYIYFASLHVDINGPTTWPLPLCLIILSYRLAHNKQERISLGTTNTHKHTRIQRDGPTRELTNSERLAILVDDSRTTKKLELYTVPAYIALSFSLYHRKINSSNKSEHSSVTTWPYSLVECSNDTILQFSSFPIFRSNLLVAHGTDSFPKNVVWFFRQFVITPRH